MNQSQKKRTGAILFALLLFAGLWLATRPAGSPPETTPPEQAAAPAVPMAQTPAPLAAQATTPAPTTTEPAAPSEGRVTRTIQAAQPTESSIQRGKKQASDTNDDANQKTSNDTEAPSAEPDAVAQMAPTAEPKTTAPPTAAPAPKPAPVTAPFVAHFKNRAGSNLRIVRVTCTLDGATVCNTTGSGNDFVLFSRPVDQGSHTLRVLVEYQGDTAGFSYFKGYRYQVGDSRRFNVASSASKGMTVTAFERGGPTTPFEERLAVSIR